MSLFFKNRTKKYLKSISCGIFDNDYANAFAQTKVAEIVRRHLAEQDGRQKKVLIYGLDGARADSMGYVIPGNDETITGHSCRARYSAITELKEAGGLYLSYAGGDPQDPKTLQQTSTAQGWAAILTGKWGLENGVQKHVEKRGDVPTVLMEAALAGKRALFASIWPDHFTITYKGEIAQAKEKKLPLTFQQVQDEEELQALMLDQIDSGCDVLFGINEFPDHNGHSTGFGPGNCRYVAGIANADRLAFELMEHIKSRDAYQKEDWLFLITSDHGGHDRGHGTQCIEDRATFIACNKKLKA